MSRHRLMLSKTGKAKYISHLDFMHTMQRVFLRAGVSIRHTEGFNPHPYMSFALPLSVGCSSVCELMDFDLTDENVTLADLPDRLNPVMPSGIEALKAYEAQRKLKELVWLEVEGSLIYDGKNAGEAADGINDFFKAESIVIQKKSKKGMAEVDIVPCIKKLTAAKKSESEVILSAVIAAQNPALNPDYLVAALRTKAPELGPDFAEFTRLNVFDKDMKRFR